MHHFSETSNNIDNYQHLRFRDIQYFEVAHRNSVKVVLAHAIDHVRWAYTAAATGE